MQIDKCMNQLQENWRPNQWLLRIGIRKSASWTASNFDNLVPSVDWPQPPLPPPLRCIPFRFFFPFLCLCLSIQRSSIEKHCWGNLLPIGRKIREIQDSGIAHHLPKTKETAFPLHPASHNGEPFLNSWPSECLGPGMGRPERSGRCGVLWWSLWSLWADLWGLGDLKIWLVMASLAEFVQGASESYSLSLCVL